MPMQTKLRFSERWEAKLGIRLFLLAVHTIGISRAQATTLTEGCDLVWSCTSKAVRDVVGKKTRLPMDVSIPIFALSQARTSACF